MSGLFDYNELFKYPWQWRGEFVWIIIPTVGIAVNSENHIKYLSQ
jgi:hypothetical protein